MNPTETIQIFYEIAMSIGNSNELKPMLQICLTQIMRKLNCSVGIIYQKDINTPLTSILSIPQIIERSKHYRPYIQNIQTQLNHSNFQKIPSTQTLNKDTFYHCLYIPQFGYLILFKEKTAIDMITLKSLNAIMPKLGNACQSCLQLTKLQESKKALNTSTQKLSKAQEIGKMGSWEWKSNKKKLFISDTLYNILEIPEKKQNYSLSDILKHLKKPDQQYLFQAIKQCFLTGKMNIILPLSSPGRKSEKYLHLLAESSAHTNIQDNLQGTAQDISDSLMSKEKSILLKEVHHRLKNNLQVFSSILDLQKNNTANKSTKDILNQLQSRIKSIALTHELMCQSNNISSISANLYIQELITHINKALHSSEKKWKIYVDCCDIILDIDTMMSCGMIINELTTNFIKYAKSANIPTLYITLTKHSEKRLLLQIRDNGRPLPHPINLENPKTLGLQLVTSFIHKLSGKLTAKFEEGVHYSIGFPKPKLKKINIHSLQTH